MQLVSLLVVLWVGVMPMTRASADVLPIRIASVPWLTHQLESSRPALRPCLEKQLARTRGELSVTLASSWPYEPDALRAEVAPHDARSQACLVSALRRHMTGLTPPDREAPAAFSARVVLRFSPARPPPPKLARLKPEAREDYRAVARIVCPERKPGTCELKCARGDAAACWVLGRRQQEDNLLSGMLCWNNCLANRWFVRACELGDHRVCHYTPIPRQLTREQLLAAFSQYRSKLSQACGSVANQSPDAPRAIVLALSIAADGKVAQVETLHASDALKACVLPQVASWRFPEAEEGIQVKFPIKL